MKALPFIVLLMAQHAAPLFAQVCETRAPVRTWHERARAISIDLTGHLPSDADRTALDGAAVGSEAAALGSLVDKWLQSPHFADRTARRHKALLWNETKDVSLLYPPYTGIYEITLSGVSVWYRPYFWMSRYRGAEVYCDPTTPATFDAQGNVLPISSVGPRIEGYVMVEPYWAPGTQVRVCGYDAQAQAVSASGESCGPWSESAGCGCGPNLVHCANLSSSAELGRSFGEEVTHRVRQLVLDDRPYDELFTDQTMYLNGPMAHWLRYWWSATAFVATGDPPLPKERIPDIAYTDSSFHRVEVAQASGVLTSFAYLLRFPTNRARANRFASEVLCQPFAPPPSGIDLSGSALEADLQQRVGCKYCHAPLEPMAAFFGRWVENGVGWLGPESFPKEREDCVTCGRAGASYCNADCRDHYFVRPRLAADYDYIGRLHAYVFRRPEHEANVERGPRGLMLASLAQSDVFARCTTTQTVRWLIGNEDASLIDQLSGEFSAGGNSYSALVRSIVLSDAYARRP
jgi:hypothetical protein